MIRLANITIHQYKSIEMPLQLNLEGDVTVLHGKNEAGKTNILEALAKSNYFDRQDARFQYDPVPDYPRQKKVEFDRRGICPPAVTAEYQVSEQLLEKIQQDVVLEASGSSFSRQTNYAGKSHIIHNSFEYDVYEFWETYILRKEPALARYKRTLASFTTRESFKAFCREEKSTVTEEEQAALARVEKFFQNLHGWSNPINEYVYRTWLLPNIPKYIYYDECSMLPSRISLNRLQNADDLSPQERTAKAFLMLADVDVEKAVCRDHFEDYRTELETAQARLNNEMLCYWTSNPNLRIEFEITREAAEPVQEERRPRFSLFGRKKAPLVNYNTWLEVRVKDVKSMVSLPLENRSRGFNWFFSFWVWFNAIRKYETGQYVLLLDEPGIHLHEDAQKDLMRFIRELSGKYQVIFTTHSPYLLETASDNTYLVVNGENGTQISAS